FVIQYNKKEGPINDFVQWTLLPRSATSTAVANLTMDVTIGTKTNKQVQPFAEETYFYFPCNFFNIAFSGEPIKGYRVVKPAHKGLFHNVLDIRNACPPLYKLKSDQDENDFEITGIRCSGNGNTGSRSSFTYPGEEPERYLVFDQRETLSCVRQEEDCTFCEKLYLDDPRFDATEEHEQIQYNPGSNLMWPSRATSNAICPSITCNTATHQFYNEWNAPIDASYTSADYPFCKYDKKTKDWQWMVKGRRGLQLWNTSSSFCMKRF
ncbi:hypothetical protein PFISCL1PPCAC_225, partial [Pristionchus fissidentatus]